MSVLVLVPLLIYISIIAFVIWYLLKFLNLQTERNEILKNISAKLDKKDE